MSSVEQDAIPSNELSPDSEDGGVQHIEDIHADAAAAAAAAAPGTGIATRPGPAPISTPRTTSTTPHRVPVLNTALLPHPFRPSDRARLLANEAAAAAAACRRPMIVRLQEMHAAVLLLDPQMQRTQMRSRDSGYEADESSNDSDGDGDGVDSDSSEDVRCQERWSGEREHECEHAQGGRRVGAVGGVRRGGVQTVRRCEGTAQVEGMSSSATVE
ncbi:hypothetical protein ATEIFO6365_0002046500 [Aspergillus terreus]|uniref:Uncharacterized protein n=1 Tax=Aspergillus terreus TaxID=33178 RepID=A0A5M3YUJ6_ASPTE|nr:hypothetical protein ATETN484_0004046500 [Aspergillus terreus]GFF13354.1 hypothetical protein ATEIFO6365_0002046500 [Aspergillus terreus]